MPSKDSSVDVTQLRKRTSKLEDVSIQSYQTEMKKGRKQNRRTSRNYRIISDSITYVYLEYQGKRDNGAENTSEVIRTENFSN